MSLSYEDTIKLLELNYENEVINNNKIDLLNKELIQKELLETENDNIHKSESNDELADEFR